MKFNPVPADVAREVAAFVAARAHEQLGRTASAADLDRQWADAQLVSRFEQAQRSGHAVTADNLAYTLLISAARHQKHPSYRQQWRQWTPFGDMEPGSHTDGPAPQEADEADRTDRGGE